MHMHEQRHTHPREDTHTYTRMHCQTQRETNLEERSEAVLCLTSADPPSCW